MDKAGAVQKDIGRGTVFGKGLDRGCVSDIEVRGLNIGRSFKSGEVFISDIGRPDQRAFPCTGLCGCVANALGGSRDQDSLPGKSLLTHGLASFPHSGNASARSGFSILTLKYE